MLPQDWFPFDGPRPDDPCELCPEVPGPRPMLPVAPGVVPLLNPALPRPIVLEPEAPAPAFGFVNCPRLGEIVEALGEDELLPKAGPAPLEAGVRTPGVDVTGERVDPKLLLGTVLNDRLPE